MMCLKQYFLERNVLYVSKIENLGTLLELPCTLSSKKFFTHKPTYAKKFFFKSSALASDFQKIQILLHK